MNPRSEVARLASIRVDKISYHDMVKVLVKIGDGLMLARTPKARVRLYQTALLVTQYDRFLEMEMLADYAEKRAAEIDSEYEKLPWYKKIFR